MSCCCTNTYDLGCQNACQPVVFPLVAPATGDYSISWQHNAYEARTTVAFEANDPITASLPLNERAVSVIRVYAPDGSQLAYTDDNDVTYDCFQVKTQPIITL